MVSSGVIYRYIRLFLNTKVYLQLYVMKRYREGVLVPTYYTRRLAVKETVNNI